jgi:hypothetical protein
LPIRRLSRICLSDVRRIDRITFASSLCGLIHPCHLAFKSLQQAEK